MLGYSRSKEDFREILYIKYKPMEEIKNGCLGVGEQTTDYQLCNGFEDTLPNLYQQDNIIYEYNQNKWSWSTKSCTLFSAIGAISDLFNYEFSETEIKEIDTLSYEKGRIENEGWYVQSAVKLVADWWNEKHSDLGKVAYYRFDRTNDEVLDKVISKGYTVMTNYNGNSKYNSDFKADKILNGTEFGTATYGHATSVISNNGVRSVKDSYKGRKTTDGKSDCNIYELEHELSEITCYGTYCYIYTKVAEDAIEEIKRLNQIITECNNAITTLGTLRHLSNEENFRSILHYTADKLRSKISDAENELKKYQ